MRTVIQRVLSASVKVDHDLVAQIGQGLLVYVGLGPADTDQDLEWMLHKILNLRIFSDDAGLMNRSVLDIEAQMLLVSQFTLYGDCRRGNRPSFTQAMPPDLARHFFSRFVELANQSKIDVQAGIFAANMLVSSQNDGPVTIIINSKKQF